MMDNTQMTLLSHEDARLMVGEIAKLPASARRGKLLGGPWRKGYLQHCALALCTLRSIAGA